MGSDTVSTNVNEAPHRQENLMRLSLTMRATWRLRSGARSIVVSVPNQSRFYDATRRAVRFWGHHSAMEASFFVNEDALKGIQSDMRFDE